MSGLAIWANLSIKAQLKFSIPSVSQTSRTFFSVVGHVLRPLTLDGSGSIVSPLSSSPRYSTLSFSNSHFSGLRNSDASFSADNTACTTSR